MKKYAQNTVDVKSQELQKVISDALGQLNIKMTQATQQLTEQVARSMQDMVTNLQREVQQKLQELKGQTVTLTSEQLRGAAASVDLPGVVREGKKHPLPRDNKDNADLPDFWRENLDLGESPYLYIDKLTKITDKVTKDMTKKRKKK